MGLFIADKAEEMQKCQDLIKTIGTLTNDHKFSSFSQVEPCSFPPLSRPDKSLWSG